MGTFWEIWGWWRISSVWILRLRRVVFVWIAVILNTGVFDVLGLLELCGSCCRFYEFEMAGHFVSDNA